MDNFIKWLTGKNTVMNKKRFSIFFLPVFISAFIYFSKTTPMEDKQSAIILSFTWLLPILVALTFLAYLIHTYLAHNTALLQKLSQNSWKNFPGHENSPEYTSDFYEIMGTVVIAATLFIAVFNGKDIIEAWIMILRGY